MDAFGRYEAVREIYRGDFGVVAEARLSGKDGKTVFAAKSYEITSSVDRTTAEAEIRAFADRVSVMQRMAQAKAPNWAPVHDAGADARGAYYVTDFYPRSLDQLATGRIRLDRGALYNIVRGIVNGLGQLREVCGRPHGAVKGPNILLDRVGQLDSVVIKLVDPAHSKSPDLAQGEAGDVRAVGRIIYHLITFKQFREIGGWPISQTADWGKLGESAKGWYELTEHLLDPSTPDSELTLDRLDQSLKALRAGGKSSKGLLKIAVVLALLAGAGAGGYFALTGGSPGPGPNDDPTVVVTDEDKQNFRTWVRGYVLLSKMASDLNNSAGRAALEQLPPKLQDTLKSLASNAREWPHNPTVKLESLSGSSTTGLLSAEPEEHLTSDEIRAQVASHAKAIREALEELSPKSAAKLREAGAWSQAYTFLGWPTEEINRITSPFDDVASRFVSSPDNQVSKLGGELALEWFYFHRDVQIIGEAGAPALRLAGLVRQFDDRKLPGKADLEQGVRSLGEPLASSESLENRFREVGVAATKVADALQSVLDAAAKRTSLPADFAPPTLTPGEFVNWLDLYVAKINQAPAEAVVVVQPRDLLKDWAIADRIAQIRSDYVTLRNQAQNLEDSRERTVLVQTAAEKIEALDAISSRVDGIREQGRNRDIPEADVNAARNALESELAQIEGAIAALSAQYNTIMAQAGQLKEALRQAIAGWTLPPGTDPALLQAAQARRQALSSALESGQDEEQLKTTLDAARQAATRAHNALTADRTPSVPPLASLTPEQRAALEAAIRTQGQSRRQAAVQALVAELDLANADAAALNAFDPASSQALLAWGAWSDGMTALLGELREAESLAFTRLLPLTEAPGGGQPSAAERLAEARRRPAFAEVESALQPVVDRFARLESVAQNSDTARLAELADPAKNDLALALAAWRRLGEISEWPGMREVDGLRQIDIEQRRAQALRNNLSILDRLDADRRRELENELATGSAARFLKAYDAATSPDDLRAARRLEASYPNFDRQNLSGRTRANLLIVGFIDERQAAARQSGTPDDTALLARIDALNTQLQATQGATPAQLQWAANLAETARNADAAPATTSGKVSNGPVAQGWTQIDPQNGGDIAFERNGAILEFAALPGRTGEGGRPVYLAVHELSIGQTRAIAEAAVSSGTPIPFDAPSSSGFDLYPWVLRGTVPSPSGVWRNESIPATSQFYPSGSVPDAPTDDTPMQQITAITATALASAVGCRLPTIDEWTAAASGTSQPPEGSNLRDDVWLSVFNHNNTRSKSSGQSFIEPDKGMFRRDRSPMGFTSSPTASGNDGVVWFWSVFRGPEPRFKNLFGNVAEYVVASENPTDFHVIGLSALCEAKPEWVASAVSVRGPERSRSADVGVRLAFDADMSSGPKPLAERIQPLVDQPAYAWSD